MTITQVCGVCGTKFETKPSLVYAGKAKYCSRACSDIGRKVAFYKVCPICGLKFETTIARLKRNRGKYCSRECMGIAYSKARKGITNPDFKSTKIKRICEICGKPFKKYPSAIKAGEGKYCSRKCMGIGFSKDYKGSNNPSWNGGKVKRTCKVCGRIILIHPSGIKIGKGSFCSKKCEGIWNSQNLRGNKNKNWKGGLVKRSCPICGKKIEVPPSTIKRGHGIFCSHSCALKANRHKAHPKKTKPEIIFEKMCKKHSLPFHFVGDGSLWLGNANPDFVHNTKKIVVEVFGDYWHSALHNKNIKETNTFKGRKEQLKKEGYRLIVFWETDLKRKDAEAFVLSTLAKNKIKV